MRLRIPLLFLSTLLCVSCAKELDAIVALDESSSEVGGTLVSSSSLLPIAFSSSSSIPSLSSEDVAIFSSSEKHMSSSVALSSSSGTLSSSQIVAVSSSAISSSALSSAVLSSSSRIVSSSQFVSSSQTVSSAHLSSSVILSSSEEQSSSSIIPVLEQCGDGFDNDRNGYADCADSYCSGSAACLENSVQNCSDAVDNDLDGGRDCFDSECAATAYCVAQKQNVLKLYSETTYGTGSKDYIAATELHGQIGTWSASGVAPVVASTCAGTSPETGTKCLGITFTTNNAKVFWYTAFQDSLLNMSTVDSLHFEIKSSINAVLEFQDFFGNSVKYSLSALGITYNNSVFTSVSIATSRLQGVEWGYMRKPLIIGNNGLAGLVEIDNIRYSSFEYGALPPADTVYALYANNVFTLNGSRHMPNLELQGAYMNSSTLILGSPDSTDKTEGANSVVIDFPAVGGWISFHSGSSWAQLNLSNTHALKFSIKTDVDVAIEVKDAGNMLVRLDSRNLGILPDNQWREIVIPVSELSAVLDMSQIVNPFGVIALQSGRVKIDNVRYTGYNP